MSMCNCNQGRMPCTCKVSQPKMVNSPQPDLYAAGAAACLIEPAKPGRVYHPLVNIAEWRKGCSCAPKEFPVQCEACTGGLILAVENWFTQHRNSRILGIAGVLEDLDARAGLPMTVDAKAAAIIRHLEAELYAAQDQIAGLQELMAAQRAPESLDVAVRHLVAHANSQSDNAPSGSPEHGHSIPGRWDGDSVNPKGALCEECAAWDVLRQYAATDITAVERVLVPVPQPMDTAPTDGTRVLIHTEVHHYSADRYQICAWRVIGTQWLEARFKDGKWAEWCGNEKTSSNNTIHPIEWAPLPAGEPQ